MTEVLPSSASSQSMNKENIHQSNGNGTSNLTSDFDPDTLRNYLEALLPALMSASPSALDESMFRSRKDPSWREIALRFANDSQLVTIYAEKVRKEDANQADQDSEFRSYPSSQDPYPY